MENKLKIEIGDGDHEPLRSRNRIPIQMELCADSRREICKYYVKVQVETDHISFYQGFCAYKHKKDRG